MNKQVKGLERFIYFIVNETSLFTNHTFRYKSSLSKLKHYMYMATKISNYIGSELISSNIHEQVLTAMDGEHSHTLKNHYVHDLWDYDFESDVELETTTAYYADDLEVPSINYLGYEEHPVVRDVSESMLSAFREDYIEIQLTEQDECGTLNTPPAVIRLPNDDALVCWLNRDLDSLKSSSTYDLSEEQEIDYVSNVGIRNWIDTFYRDMVTEMNPHDDFTTAEDKYFELIDNLDILTMLHNPTQKEAKDEY